MASSFGEVQVEKLRAMLVSEIEGLSSKIQGMGGRIDASPKKPISPSRQSVPIKVRMRPLSPSPPRSIPTTPVRISEEAASPPINKLIMKEQTTVYRGAIRRAHERIRELEQETAALRSEARRNKLARMEEQRVFELKIKTAKEAAHDAELLLREQLARVERQLRESIEKADRNEIFFKTEVETREANYNKNLKRLQTECACMQAEMQRRDVASHSRERIWTSQENRYKLVIEEIKEELEREQSLRSNLAER